MEDLTAKLSSLLENPAELEQMKNLAGALLGGGQTEASSQPSSAQSTSSQPSLSSAQPSPPAAGNGAGGPDPSALLASLLSGAGSTPSSSPEPTPGDGLLSSISPKEIQAIMKLGSVLKSKRPDDRSQLLLALKPHLSPARQERVDQAVKILRILDILPLLKDSGLDLFGSLL